MKKIIVLTNLILLITVSASAQFDSIVNSFQQEFDEFKQDIEQEHYQFKNKNDSVFAKFLKDSWQEFEVFYKKVQEPPKPVVQPAVKKQEYSPQEITPVMSDSAKTPDFPQGNIEKIPEEEPEKQPSKPVDNFGRAVMDFDFYGAKASVLYPGKLPALETIDAEDIENYFGETSNMVSVYELVEELWQTRQRLRLNDWGYYKLVQQTARHAEAETSRQTLFAWVVLLKSGYNVKVGYAGNKIFLMLPVREEIYSSYYLTIDSIPYYIQTGKGNKGSLPRLRVHRANYPGNNVLSLHLPELPDLGEFTLERELFYRGDTITVKTNKWLAEFYNDYPLCNMQVHFSAPLSGAVIQPLENYFSLRFAGKTDREKVETLLGFVQHAFEYKTDGDQFGGERYFFSDEIFYYPFSDCEDRSVLFARLVTHFTEYGCIGLDFPGHVNTAVHFPDDAEGGSFVRFNNKKYLICDPTYTGAPIGYLDKRYAEYHPEIITFRK
jgi:hypothetical protein